MKKYEFILNFLLSVKLELVLRVYFFCSLDSSESVCVCEFKIPVYFFFLLKVTWPLINAGQCVQEKNRKLKRTQEDRIESNWSYPYECVCVLILSVLDLSVSFFSFTIQLFNDHQVRVKWRIFWHIRFNQWQKFITVNWF